MSTPLLFGKLPAHGDFVSRGMQAARRDTCDAWLTASFQSAQERFADDWRERFDRAPPWLFAVRTPDGFEAGALCASIDKAGRRFPLLAGIATTDADQLVAVAAHALEGLYNAIGERRTADDLMEMLATPAIPENCPVSASETIEADCWWAVDANGAVVARLAEARPANLLSEMLALSEIEADHAT